MMQLAQVPANWPADAKAAAIVAVLQDLIDRIANPRWQAAARAAFRLPAVDYQRPEHDSLAGRWRELARSEGITEANIRARIEAYRGYWIAAAGHLADRLEQQFDQLGAASQAWQAYRPETLTAPSRLLPVSFDRTDVLYRFQGQRGIQSISYRWLTAYAPIDHYEAVGWYYSEPDAPIDIAPLANCTLDGPLRDLPQGGRSGTLRFSHSLESGERYFFAYATNFNSERPCRPAILYETRGQAMRSLIIRAQFDLSALPVRCWHFAVESQNEGWEAPGADSPELLKLAGNGYIEYEFTDCERGHKYGLRWDWGDDHQSF